MNREYHRWYSTRLGRDMEVLLFGHSGEPVLLLPTSKGRFYQAEDFGLIGALTDRIQAGRYLVVCADSVDEESWFNTSIHPHDRVARHAAYEQYLLHEVVPLVMSRSTGGRLTLGGCSFGGFHTYNIGLRYPNTFRRLISMGGKFETEDFLDGYHDDSVYYHSSMQWLPGLGDAAQLEAMRRVEMVLAVGEHDFCRPSNENLSKLLWSKDIGNHLAIWGGGTHDWPVWREMIQHYLPW
ncbi:esterase family protein [Archangium sp.]|uniref:esterase family protein n=1 Tax=Archangium sp. TaxID=1872627 RepID=UPI002D6F6081|nr:alpha/beta hydrolase-fold protein [Archangium sp.]HYO53898.1 alpha/beta hydrolase-fold protein [Archangium sp.]